jgi:hypothetical protein
MTSAAIAALVLSIAFVLVYPAFLTLVRPSVYWLPLGRALIASS